MPRGRNSVHGPYSQHHILPTLRTPYFCHPGERYFVLPGDSPLSSRVTRPRSPGQHVHVLGRAKSYPPYPCLCVSWHLVFPARLSFVHKNSSRFPFSVPPLSPSLPGRKGPLEKVLNILSCPLRGSNPHCDARTGRGGSPSIYYIIRCPLPLPSVCCPFYTLFSSFS